MTNCVWHNAYEKNGELNCLSCLRRNLSLLSELDEVDLTLLNKNKTDKFYSKNEQIFKQGTKPTGVYSLSGGKAKNLRMNDVGSQQIIGLHKPVEFLGFYDFISDHSHTFSAIALEDCSVCFIPMEDFMTVLSRNNSLAIKALRFVGRQYAANIERMSNLASKHMRGRMADTLLYIYELFEVESNFGVLDIELKRRDFADLANMNTANAIRTLSEFTKSGLIELHKTHIVFHDIATLRQISSVG